MISLRDQVRPLLTIAIPVILAELGWMLMGITDTIMVGRISAEAIGAVAVGNVIFNTIGLLAIGLLLGLDTLISQAFGAKDMQDAHHSFRQGLWLGAFVGPLLLLGMWAAIPLLRLWQLDPGVLALAEPFTWILAWSVLPVSLYTVFRRYLQSTHQVGPIMFSLLSANIINAGLNWVLIYGHWGAPAMGVNGSAWATVGARVYMALVLLIALLRTPEARLKQLFRWEGPDSARLWKLFWLGLPSAGHIFVEIAVFAAATALAARFPPVALAAHEIVLNHASLTFMVPLGISQGASVLVGQATGAKLPREAEAAGWTGILAGAGFMALSGLLMFAIPETLIRLYTPNAAVIAAAVPLLFWAAMFQLFDGIQVTAIGALRGLGDTKTPFSAGIFGYWVLGLPVGAYLCFVSGYGVKGLWIGLSAGLAIVSAILTLRWRRSAAA
jgi:multidrug resistance protein, MATE family